MFGIRVRSDLMAKKRCITMPRTVYPSNPFDLYNPTGWPVSDLGSWEWKNLYGFSSPLSQTCILACAYKTAHIHRTDINILLTTVIRTTFPSGHFLASVGRPMAGLTCESMMRIALAVINPLSASVIYQVENWWTRRLQVFKASSYTS